MMLTPAAQTLVVERSKGLCGVWPLLKYTEAVTRWGSD